MVDGVEAACKNLQLRSGFRDWDDQIQMKNAEKQLVIRFGELEPDDRIAFGER